jgi:hypothetical protein
MGPTDLTPAEQKLQFLRELEQECAWIAGDILQVASGLWAVHGVIPVDGDVLMAEFDSYAEARRTLDALSPPPWS